jgi:arabinose-5-phosphate isomerase
MRAVLHAESNAIASVQVNVSFEAAAVALRHSQLVMTTGMGKAGIVAQKCAATLSSTGTPCVFLHPGEASHGDLGSIVAADTVLAFSTSGKTAEVLETLTAAKRLKPSLVVVGITSHADAPMRPLCDLVLDMGTIEEPCPLGLTPTASTAVMLAIADALAIAVMEMRGTTREDFGVRHRSGYLGAQAAFAYTNLSSSAWVTGYASER